MLTLLAKARSRGFTLTELAIVLGVAGMILGGIWAAWSAVSLKMQTNRFDQQITMIVQNIRELYPAPRVFAGTSWLNQSARYAAAGVFPTEMLDNAGLPRDPWGNLVELYTPPPGADNVFTFAIASAAGTTPEACQAIIKRLVVSATERVFVATKWGPGIGMINNDPDQISLTDPSDNRIRNICNSDAQRGYWLLFWLRPRT